MLLREHITKLWGGLVNIKMGNFILKHKLFISILVIFLLVCVFTLTDKKAIEMWQYEGTILENVMPAVSGDMYVDKSNSIYLFDSAVEPLIEFAPYEPPPLEELDNFVPPLKEEWMGSMEEVFNRSVVRLFKTEPNGKPQLLFQELGQASYWWRSNDIKTIYILTQWRDAKKKNESPYLTLWKSTDSGNSFAKLRWNNHQIGRGNAFGIYFDDQDLNGYIFVEKNILLQTNDSGATWSKLYIPHTDYAPLPDSNSNIDAATVDKDGNLLFSLFKEGGSSIYEIPNNNKETDLSQIQAKYQISDKRILNITSIPNNEGLYFFYLSCKDQQCTWYKKDKKNQPLHFAHFLNGNYITDSSLGFFAPIKKVYSDNVGKIAVILNIINSSDNKLLLSNNYGKTWMDEDMTGVAVISNYIDLKKETYWQFRMFNEVYLAKDIFK